MNLIKTTAAFCLAAGATTAMGQNLVTNGDFENLGPGAILFQGWEPPFGNVFLNSQDPKANEPAQSGTNSCKMFGTFPGVGNQGDSGIFQFETNRIPVTGGEVYTYGASTYNPSGDAMGEGNVAFVFAQWFNAAGNQVRQDEIIMAEFGGPTDEWITKTSVVTAPADAVEVGMFLLHIQTLNNGGAILFDDITFVEGGDVVEPCVVDLNNDDQLNIDDVLLFLQLFAQGCTF